MHIPEIQNTQLHAFQYHSTLNPTKPMPISSLPQKRSALHRRLRQETFAQKNLPFLSASSNPGIERRAVVDVGSGGTKVCIADVNTLTNEIVEVLFQTSFSVKYQASLEESEDQAFGEEIQEKGLEVFREINELLASYGVDKKYAIATEAFRKSVNGQKFPERIFAETGINVQIIPQEQEGILAFYSALANNPDLVPDDVLAWDIGTGSFQMTIEDEMEMSVFMGDVGSIPFRNYILEIVQGKELSDDAYIHPMTEEEWAMADSYARSLARTAFPNIKEKIKLFEGKVLGIGRLFFNSIKPLAVNADRITRKDLRSYIRETLSKTPQELFDDPYATVDLSNAILVLGFMKALHIHEVCPLDTTSTAGMLTYPEYWV